jgi:hypothetical protein
MNPIGFRSFFHSNLCLAFVVLAGGGSLTEAHGQQVVDQSNIFSVAGGFTGKGVDSSKVLAQTLTVGQSGYLTQIDVQILRFQSTLTLTSDLVLTVTAPADLSFPVGPVLTSITLHPSDVPTFDQFPTQSVTSIYLPASAVPVTQGEFLSIVLTSTQPYDGSNFYMWASKDPEPSDNYPGGAAWRNYSNTGFVQDAAMEDFGFRTYVTVPEPAALPVLGFVLLAARKRIGRIGRRR